MHVKASILFIYFFFQIDSDWLNSSQCTCVCSFLWKTQLHLFFFFACILCTIEYIKSHLLICMHYVIYIIIYAFTYVKVEIKTLLNVLVIIFRINYPYSKRIIDMLWKYNLRNFVNTHPFRNLLGLLCSKSTSTWTWTLLCFSLVWFWFPVST